MNRRLAHLRLVSQRILGSALRTPSEAVRWMLAMQAQDYAGAKWSVGLRVPGSTEASVDAAVASAEIVRSWPMRGTLHFTHAEDLHWVLAVTTPRPEATLAGRRAELGLDGRSFERARALAVRRLEGNKIATRTEMLEVFERGRLSTEGQRGYHILGYLAQSGTLCIGPPKEREQTFVLLDEWVKRSGRRGRFTRDEGLGELARRYFTSHGPATLRDFARWPQLTLRDAKIGLVVARADLATLTADGETYFMAKDAEDELARLTRTVKGAVVLLPGFDEYVLGYGDRAAVLDPKHAERIVPGSNGVFQPTIVHDGAIVGTWRRAMKAEAVVVEPVGFRRLSPAVAKSIARAAGAYTEFVGGR